VAAVPIKPEYGPTLGRLLAPRWRAASPLARGAVIAAGVGLLALVVATGLTLLNSTYSRGGRVPFSFSYRNLYRVAPEPGGYVRVQRRRTDGRLEDSFAVGPLRLQPYSGNLFSELPLYAASYIPRLARSYPHFVLRGEGKTTINTAPAYDVFFTALVEGHKMYGRNVLLLPETPGAREGVVITMLTAPKANPQVTSATEVAKAGVLLKPVRTFTLN